jgi:hypothetical protein
MTRFVLSSPPYRSSVARAHPSRVRAASPPCFYLLPAYTGGGTLVVCGPNARHTLLPQSPRFCPHVAAVSALRGRTPHHGTSSGAASLSRSRVYLGAAAVRCRSDRQEYERPAVAVDAGISGNGRDGTEGQRENESRKAE